MKYDLEIKKVIEEIKKAKAKSVLIQLPEGLKSKADEIVSAIEKIGVDAIIWIGSCYGSCDIPKADVDMVVQWGHSQWRA